MAASFWPPALAATAFLLIGAALALRPHPAIRAYIGVLKPMRSLFGRNLIDWEIGLLRGWAAPLLVRLFGLFVMLSGASIFFFRLTR